MSGQISSENQNKKGERGTDRPETGCGFFLKINRGCFPHGKLIEGNMQTKPYFSILNEDSTVRLFFDALLRDNTEEAFCYVSRNLPTNVDFHEIRGILNSGSDYKYLIKASAGARKRGCKTNSILIINKERRNSIMHVHLIKEPDSFGNWKIFGINCERS